MADSLQFLKGASSAFSTTSPAIRNGTVYFVVDEENKNFGQIYIDNNNSRYLMGSSLKSQTSSVYDNVTQNNYYRICCSNDNEYVNNIYCGGGFKFNPWAHNLMLHTDAPLGDNAGCIIIVHAEGPGPSNTMRLSSNKIEMGTGIFQSGSVIAMSSILTTIEAGYMYFTGATTEFFARTDMVHLKRTNTSDYCLSQANSFVMANSEDENLGQIQISQNAIDINCSINSSGGDTGGISINGSDCTSTLTASMLTFGNYEEVLTVITEDEITTFGNINVIDSQNGAYYNTQIAGTGISMREGSDVGMSLDSNGLHIDGSEYCVQVSSGYGYEVSDYEYTKTQTYDMLRTSIQPHKILFNGRMGSSDDMQDIISIETCTYEDDTISTLRIIFN